MRNSLQQMTNSRIDWERFDMQEGLRPPKDKCETADREKVKNLTPELKAERDYIINQFCRIADVYKRFGTGVKNYALREEAFGEILNRRVK